MTHWYSISVTVLPQAAEAIEYAFNSLDSLGTEINHLKKKNSESVVVVGYFDAQPDHERVQDEFHYALRIYGLGEDSILNIERDEVENRDWLSEWKKHWRPTKVGGFVISPPWSEVAEDDSILIRIEPNMAFGTGTHETTQLCLRAIEKYYVPGDSFLDVGTGTGILAVAAAGINLKSQISDFKLIACDTDRDSVSLARENARRNGVGDFIEFTVGSITKSTATYDFVCANLTLDVIGPNLDLLIEKSRKTLVLSGILLTQQSEIESQLSELGRDNVEIASAGEWIRVVLGKNYNAETAETAEKKPEQ